MFVVVVKIRVYQLQCVMYLHTYTFTMLSHRNDAKSAKFGVVGCVGNIENQQSHIDLEQEFVGVDRNHGKHP